MLNALTAQDVAIVSDFAGTTTDPVEKAMEMLPLGPVLFIDTAGIDDIGALGEQRIGKTRQAFNRTDVALVVTDSGALGEFENRLLDEFAERSVPAVVVFNKSDLVQPGAEALAALEERKVTSVALSALTGDGVPQLKEALIRTVPEDFVATPSIVGDLLPPGELAVLVVPHRHRGAEGQTDPSAGADDPRHPRQRRLHDGRQGT